MHKLFSFGHFLTWITGIKQPIKMTHWPADATAFSYPTSIARETCPGDKVTTQDGGELSWDEPNDRFWGDLLKLRWSEKHKKAGSKRVKSKRSIMWNNFCKLLTLRYVIQKMLISCWGLQIEMRSQTTSSHYSNLEGPCEISEHTDGEGEAVECSKVGTVTAKYKDKSFLSTHEHEWKRRKQWKKAPSKIPLF